MSSDVLVIGGGIPGLVAATYLARAGNRVTLLEAQDHLGGFCAPTPLGDGLTVSPGARILYALDPRMIADLKLARNGLKFAARDMPLVGLHGDGKHIVLQRDVHAAAANIAVHSAEDARAWPQYRRELFDLARATRPLWWGEKVPPKPEALRRVERMAKTGAVAWLDSWFESDVLKAALCFDATEGGLSPIEPGSALTLVWRAAQEMSGLQGAVEMAGGDTLVQALTAAARTAGVNIQTGARVVALMSDGESVSGVQLENGETRTASQIVCSLSRRQVFLKMLPPLAGGIARTVRYVADGAATGEARVQMTLRDPPQFGGTPVPANARFVLSESPGAITRADFAARTGRLADELPMEIVISSAADDVGTSTGQHIVSMLVRPVPANPLEGWQSLKPKLVEHAIQALERFAPGTAAGITAVKVFAPDKADNLHYHANVDHLLANYETRTKSPLQGLLFCGGDAEPVPAVSGRAARLAAAMLTVRR